MRTFDITLTVQVIDEQALLKAALISAMKPMADGRVFYASEEVAREELTEEDGSVNIQACIQEVLDPGISPPGLEIEECQVEEFTVHDVEFGDERN
jgi:hypothetical protein